MTWLGIDVGGANLKVADGRGYGESVAFPLWQTPGGLAAVLKEMLDRAPPADGIAATMTGELADCFATKRTGVKTIVRALWDVAAERPLRIYATSGRMLSPQMAIDWPVLVAAANWHVLGQFAATLVGDEPAMLVDIGSTTADLIPLVGGHPRTRGLTDTERLVAGELVYSGVERSPVCAITRSVPYRGRECPLAQELFATAWDAYLVLGDLPEEPKSRHTADGRPATRIAARRRLARAVCADRTEFSPRDAQVAARAIADEQFKLLDGALAQVAADCTVLPRTFVVSGQGEFLARRLVERRFPAARVISLGQRLGPTLSRVAPAHALATLAHEDPRSVAPIRRVIKVGGSLLDWPGLESRLARWLARYPGDRSLLIAGCGALTEVVREKQASQGISDARAHWLCIDDMSVTAQVLHEQLPSATLCSTLEEVNGLSQGNHTIVFDVDQFLRDDEPRLPGDRLPESWDVSSDSIAARLADAWDADELVLLKSTTAPVASVATAIEAGYIDPFFDRAWSRRMPLRWVNLRERGFPDVRLPAARRP